MGTVLKKIVTKAKPEKAETFTRDGERWARWKDRNGKTRKAKLTIGKDGHERIVFEARTYYAKYRDGAGVIRVVPTGCKDETAARSVLANLERRSELVKANVITSAEDATAQHQRTPMQANIDAYGEHMCAKELSATHRAYTKRHLERIVKECSFATIKDLSRESFEHWLVQMAEQGGGARTRNCYRDDLVTFCNWCVMTHRLMSNPFESISKANVEADRKRKRRSMNEDELRQLLDMARRRPLLDAQTVRRGKRKGQAYANLRDDTKQTLDWLGRERALIYKTLILTGLRKGELASLSVGQLHLDEGMPFIALDAADEKNRQGNDIVIRDDLADDLRRWLADTLERLQAEARDKGEPIPARLPMEKPLFTVPAGLLRILNRDLIMAGISKKDERGRTLDVHALRTTFGTLLSKGGVAPRTAQAAMRHSDIRMTMQTYTDPKLLDVQGALDVLPTLSLNAAKENTVEATGTDGKVDETLQALSSVTARKFAPEFAPTSDNEVKRLTTADKMNSHEQAINPSDTIAVSAELVKRKNPLTFPVNGCTEWALRGSNPRPHGCDPCALTS
jgi:integrase